MAFDPNQPRDRRGRWTDAAGVLRMFRSIEEVQENIRPRRQPMTRQRLANIRQTARSIVEGTAPAHALEFASPRLRAEAIRRTGSPRMPVAQALERELRLLRGKSVRFRRDVVRNPLTGRFRAVEPTGADLLRPDLEVRTPEGRLVAEKVRPRRRASARR